MSASSGWTQFTSLGANQVRPAGALGWEPDPPAGMRRSGYVTIASDLYAVSHATGAATLIQGLGKVPTTFTDRTYFRHYPSAPDAPKLYGE